jgi:multidrug efflux pump subunit AcrB
VSLARFAVRKPVPVNLLMMAVLLAGIVSGLSLRREFFPESDPEMALVTLPYPGATPSEIEETLAIKVEDALIDLDEVKELRTTLAEGGGGIEVEFVEGQDPDKALDEVERKINALLDLPEESERITVQLFEPRLPVIRLSIYGDADERVLKQAIRAVRDDLRELPDMGTITIDGVRGDELRIDVRRAALLEQGISLPRVADAVRSWMRETPGGMVKSNTGNVRVRTMGVQERREAIRDIVVKAAPDGRLVRVRDLALVSEDFVDEQLITRFNGKPAAEMTIYAVGNQDIVTMAEMVRAYVKGRNNVEYHPTAWERWLGSKPMEAWEFGHTRAAPLPAGVKITTSTDLARFVEGRLDLLVRNACSGAVLVFATLFLFLNWRASLWVGSGLITAVLGTLVLMAWLDITLNLLTMFGLIVVLGMLVDDGIVIAENIQWRHDRGEKALDAAISGADEVMWPVVATVLTTVVAFIPLTFIKGQIGDLLGALPMVVSCALLMSLVEAVLILPSHMGHSLSKRDRSRPGKFVHWVRRLELKRDAFLFERIVPAYGKLLGFSLRFRWVSIAISIATLMVSVGLVAGGRVIFTFLPKSDAESFVVEVRLPIGSPIARTDAVVRRVEQAAFAQSEVTSVGTIIGMRVNIDTSQADAATPHVAQLYVELKFVEDRDRESAQVIASIRQALQGKIDEVERISFDEIGGGPGGADISIQVRGGDQRFVHQAVDELKGQLAAFAGVHDIADNSDLGQLEQRFHVTASGAALGFTAADVAQQVRGYLFGIDAHTYAHNEEDIDVRVRLDEPTRRSLYGLETMWVIGPDGRAAPLSEVARIEETTAYATIRRVDRQRAVTVQADTAPGVSPETITENLNLNALRAKYPMLHIDYGGRQEQMADAFSSLPYGFLAAVVMIYVILAWLFNSYLQPIVVMLTIPFGFVGVAWGHFWLGYDMTFLSLIGFVALSGIVVNDSLILMEFYNSERVRGQSVFDSLVASGRNRLRSIFLTTITTVFGLLPLILEQSFQAKFLIPMAISIAMGLMGTTVLVLLALPCFVLAAEDVKAAAYFLWHGHGRHATAPDHEAADERR